LSSYIIRRTLLLIPTILLVTIIVFITIRLIPGSIIDVMMGEMGTEALGEGFDREALISKLGLDVPIHEQYVMWLGDIITHGSLGNALRGQETVNEKLIARIPVTFEIGVLALIIALIIAIPIGIFSAIRQDTIGDWFARGISIIFISIPSFWMGTLIMIYPAKWWGWSPSMTLIRFSEDPIGNLQMFIVPSLVLGMVISGTTMRMTRTMMLEVLRQDYIRAAWAKGLTERTVVLRHAIKNALIPVVTIVGMQIPYLIGGSVIIEQIFVLPGVGRLMIESLSFRDYPVVSGINLFIALIVVGVNLSVDLLYSYLDPRVRYK